MKVAVLCNGPSRVLWNGDSTYDLLIGCNIPWTSVDYTVVLDSEVVQVMLKDPSQIKYKIYFGHRAWSFIESIRKQKVFDQYSLGVRYVEKNYHSSGHVAAEIALERGATQIDVYGCDSYWSNDVSTYTRNFVDWYGTKVDETVAGWRSRWITMQQENPKVKFVFVGVNAKIH